MATKTSWRNYSLVGPETDEAIRRGLAGATWYSAEIPRKRMKELMRRSDGPAARNTLLWLALMIVSGGLGVYYWATWACVPFFFVYGALYKSGGDARWHEAGHGTMFRTRWMDDALYQLSSFLVMRNPTVWRWSHARHHTDTIIVGRDQEIQAMRPAKLALLIIDFFGVVVTPRRVRAMVRHTSGRLTAAEKELIPASERPKVARTARIWVAIYLAVIVTCIVTHSLLPAMLIGLPSFYGNWFVQLVGLTQHAGLAEDVLDHRLNSRTIYMNPVFRFVYCEMNYHVEHHMFPMVPFHRLGELHAEMKDDCPVPYPSLWAAYRELIPTLVRQMRDPTHFIHRQLPPTARPHPLRIDTHPPSEST